MFSPQERRVVGEEAKQLLRNPHFVEAWDAVAGYLDQVALSCDPDNKDKAQRIVISRQLLQAVRQEFIRKVEDGEMAEIEIAELERKRRPLRFER
jgi:hypothetical protein